MLTHRGYPEALHQFQEGELPACPLSHLLEAVEGRLFCLSAKTLLTRLTGSPGDCSASFPGISFEREPSSRLPAVLLK